MTPERPIVRAVLSTVALAAAPEMSIAYVPDSRPASNVPEVTCAAEMAIAVCPAAVTNPFAFTVTVLTCDADPKEPTLLFTVASVRGIDAFAAPVKAALVPVPSPETLMVLPVCRAVAVLALPVSAPVKVVLETDVNPDRVEALAPKAMLVLPTVIVLFVSAPFGMLVNPAPDPTKPVPAVIVEVELTGELR